MNQNLITVFLDGKGLLLPKDQPVAVSLYEKGIKLLSRSQKFHRPRGIFCLKGRCASCLATVYEIPNQNLCKTFPEEGMRIKRQNYFGDFLLDAGRMADLVCQRALNLESSFTFSKSINNIFIRGVRLFSGLGKAPIGQMAKENKIAYKRLDYEIAIVGGGPAGIHAAFECANLGISTCLIDENRSLGGHLLYENPSSRLKFNLIDERMALVEIAESRLRDLGVAILKETKVIGILDNALRAVNKTTSYEIRAKRYIIATGADEEFPIFENNDLPGIIGIDSAKILLYQHKIKLKDNIVLSIKSRRGLLFAHELLKMGLSISAIIFENDNKEYAGELLPFASIPSFFNYKIIKGSGFSVLSYVIIEDQNGAGISSLKADTLIVEGTRCPNYGLTAQSGGNLTYDDSNGIIKPVLQDDFKTTQNIYTTGEAAAYFDDIHISGALSAINAVKSIDGKLIENEREKYLLSLRTKKDG